MRRVYARVDGDALCPGCYRAGVRCARCGQVGVADRGLCWACRLADRVEGLRVRAGRDRGERLASYLDALAASSNAQSTMRWMQTRPFSLVHDLVDGRLELSH
jgi:hypothetical protein